VDNQHVDSVLRALTTTTQRRAAVRGLLAGLGLTGPLGLVGTGAKRKKKKRKTATPGQLACPSSTTLCNGTCIATSECCGGCGGAQKCCNGRCIAATQCCVCDTGKQCCDGDCIPLADCCGGCGANTCCAGNCVDLMLNGNCGACGVICDETCLQGVCTCNSGFGSCPAACNQCATRLEGGFVCTDGSTTTVCGSDDACPARSVCLDTGGGNGRCSKPCI
jgi:hypothetical protein